MTVLILSLLLSTGILNSPEDWNSAAPDQQIIGLDDVFVEATNVLPQSDNVQNFPCSKSV